MNQEQVKPNILNKLLSFITKKDDSSALKYKNLAITLCFVLAMVVLAVFLFKTSSDNNLKLHPNDNETSNEVSFEDNNAYAIDDESSIDADIEAQQALTLNNNQNQANNTQQDYVETTQGTDNEQVSSNNEATAPSPFDAVKNAPQNNETSNNAPVINSTKLDSPNLIPQENTNKKVETNKNQQQETTVNTQVATPTKQQELPQKTVVSSYDMYCGTYKTIDSANEAKAQIAFATGLRSNVVRHGNSYSIHLGPYKTRDAAINDFNKLDNAALTDKCSLESK